jgi:mono/diheme cytochrome c family protein
MTRKLLILAIVLCAIGAAAFWFIVAPATIPAAELGPHQPDLKNGETMFYVGGCASCHATPEQDDRKRLGGGLGLTSPFGTFYVPNISSHPTDGLGAWNEAQFVTAMLKGTSPDGQHYYPSFPYASYQKMRITDVRDLFAFLKTLPAVPGRVRAHDLPFPFNIRMALGGWKLLYVDGNGFEPNPAQTAEWNRGAYLVNGPGHCAECHSPRDILGGIRTQQRFAGGPDPEGKGWVPNITQARLGSWSKADIVELLLSGQTPDGDTVGGSMVSVVRNTEQLPAADREAMAAYIKSLPAVEGARPPARK